VSTLTSCTAAKRTELSRNILILLMRDDVTGLCIDESNPDVTWTREYHAQPMRIVHTTKTATWEHVLLEVSLPIVARIVERMCALSMITSTQVIRFETATACVK
jgi:hypothetical protein